MTQYARPCKVPDRRVSLLGLVDFHVKALQHGCVEIAQRCAAVGRLRFVLAVAEAATKIGKPLFECALPMPMPLPNQTILRSSNGAPSDSSIAESRERTRAYTRV